MLKRLFSFPNPVNEYSARMVAGGVVLMSTAYIFTGNIFILAILTYGFWARVLSGPTLSPLGQLVTRVLAPLLAKKIEPKFCPGPPKRFAQGIGCFITSTALFCATIGGSIYASKYVVGLVLFAASCESILGYCFGCAIFSKLMQLKIIPESICEKCVNYRNS